MKGVRTTVQIDDALMARIRRLVPSRGFNRFVNEALTIQAELVERAAVEAQMQVGYVAAREDRRELNRDWRGIEGEGWPE